MSIPPNSDDVEDCSYLKQTSINVDIGEFSLDYLNVEDKRITLETPYSVPSALISATISFELDGVYEKFDIKRSFPFKINLYGEDVVQ